MRAIFCVIAIVGLLLVQCEAVDEQQKTEVVVENTQSHDMANILEDEATQLGQLATAKDTPQVADNADSKADAANSLLDVDSGAAHENDSKREARQFRTFGFGRPFFGGGFGRPFFGGGFGRPFYGGGFGRPFYGGGFGRPFYGRPFYGGGFGRPFFGRPCCFG